MRIIPAALACALAWASVGARATEGASLTVDVYRLRAPQGQASWSPDRQAALSRDLMAHDAHDGPASESSELVRRGGELVLAGATSWLGPKDAYLVETVRTGMGIPSVARMGARLTLDGRSPADVLAIARDASTGDYVADASERLPRVTSGSPASTVGGLAHLNILTRWRSALVPLPITTGPGAGDMLVYVVGLADGTPP